MTSHSKSFDRVQIMFIAAFLGIALIGLGQLWAREIMHVEDCRPYYPTDKCSLGRYEIRIHDITERGQIIGVAEGACVVSVGQGKHKRYAMPEATFTAMNKTDYFERGVEIPAVQSVVCRIQ